MLEVKNLYVGYGDLPVLKGVSFQIDEGEFVALLGSNNAGKSTLAKCLSGLILPWQGQKSFDGVDFTQYPSHRIVELGIVQVPEGRKVFPEMSVRDNLILGGINPNAKQDRKEELSSVFSLFPRLKERAGQIAGTLSGGEQQMLAIGRALMAKPKFLVLDEPSLGLAPLIVQDILEALKKLNHEGLTIFLIEQDLNTALSYAHRGFVLEQGELVVEGTSEELKSNEKTRKAYLGL